MNDIDEIYAAMNRRLKSALLHEHTFSTMELNDDIIIISSVCYNSDFLILYLNQGNRMRRRRVSSLLKKLNVDVHGLRSTYRIFYGRMLVSSRKYFRELTICP